MNKQEIFDKIWNGFEAQDWQRSMRAGSYICYYRHPDDTRIRCGAGHLIPDELYNPFMEGIRFGGVNEGTSVFEEVMENIGVKDNSDELWMIRDIQRIHDSPDSSEDMKHKIKEYAIAKGLVIPNG